MALSLLPFCRKILAINIFTYLVQAMWFLVHCYEDQGKIDDASKMRGELAQITRGFGGEGLGQQHKFWTYVREKNEELLALEGRHETYSVADDEIRQPTNLSSPILHKKVVKDFTF